MLPPTVSVLCTDLFLSERHRLRQGQLVRGRFHLHARHQLRFRTHRRGGLRQRHRLHHGRALLWDRLPQGLRALPGYFN